MSTSASINLATAFGFLVAFALLRIQPFNDRVYVPKWYLKGIRGTLTTSATNKFFNLDTKTYLKFLNWMPAALRMPEAELIDHAGLDSATYVRIYLLGLKIFVPITIVSLAVLVPVNYTNDMLERSKEVNFNGIDKLSISNVPTGSLKFVAHLILSHLFSIWTCCVLYYEYKHMATRRILYLASQSRRADMFTVLVRNVPPDPDESVSEHVEHFFSVVYNANRLAKLVGNKKSLKNRLVYYQNKYERHPEKLRPSTKTGFLGLLGDKVDAIDYYKTGIALKIFLALLPLILMFMSKIEGHTSLSSLDRRTAAKYHLFILLNVFLRSILAGSALQQFDKLTNQATSEYLETLGRAMPLKGTFFITYIMVDGWSGVALEIIRLPALVMYHLQNTFLVKTDQDREEATNPGSVNFPVNEPRIQLYVLMGLVYSVVMPILLPFILIFFAFAYVVFRHQIINVYNQQYESGAAFWPYVHMRVIIGLMISQVMLIGLFRTLQVKYSTYVLLAQPLLTFWFHRVCKGRFEPAFVKFPLQDAMVKDTVEKATEPNLNLMKYLKDAYVHPNFKEGELNKLEAIDEEEKSPLVPTKRMSQMGSKLGSEDSD